MKVRLNYPAPAHTRFAPTAFDQNVGKVVTLNIGADMRLKGRMITAEATPSLATFTIEVEDPDEAVQLAMVLATGVLRPFAVEEIDDQES